LEDAANAIRALASSRFREECRQRVAQAVEQRGESELLQIFRKEFAR
jgi:hypothetical protein